MASRRRTQSDPLTTGLTTVGHGLAGIGKWLWRTLRGQAAPKKLNQAALFADWQQIQTLGHSTDAARLAQAVQQADRFLDHVMQQVGARGATFADRLRSLEPKLGERAYQGVWDAHKLRNTLAHQHGSRVSARDAEHALAQFRTAARELGAF